MDFFNISEKVATSGEHKGMTIVSPSFIVGKSEDLMIRGKGFYAIWNDATGLWDADAYAVPRLVDAELIGYTEDHALGSQFTIIQNLTNFATGSWQKFMNYSSLLPDNYTQLDERITFADTPVKKSDYVSRRLPYNMQEGSIEAYEELMSTLYLPEERLKLEWAVGSIISGDSKSIQKFLVLYGESGAGKSTFLNIVQKLFEGYCATIDAKELTTKGSNFATAQFASNPLVAIQHDGDLSRIEDNTLLNSIASHEDVLVNEKFKAAYSARLNSMLFIGTNKPVKITDAKSGIIRRLIDVRPSGNLIPEDRYHILVNRVGFELGAIAKHCLNVYRTHGKSYYSSYRPEEMIQQTDVFFNFVEDHYYEFKEAEGVTLRNAHELYKAWCADGGTEFPLPKHKFREELRNYFREFHERLGSSSGKRETNVYQGFRTEKFGVQFKPPTPFSISLDSEASLLDDILAEAPAQYATDSGVPTTKWKSVKSKLSEIDTHKVHFVKVPENHIVIDFDLKNDQGEKDLELNIKAASMWPPTYAEFSKSGSGLHLHYLYEGDVASLSRIFSEGIEVKVFTGDSSLRRRLTQCNTTPIATLSGGLPLKEKPMIDQEVVRSERGLRSLIERNLRKEIHPGTKPSIDFIHKILSDAYKSGIAYSVVDLRPMVLTFAAKSSNQSAYCVRLVSQMKFQSEGAEPIPPSDGPYNNPDRITFFDIEVFPNLFHISWKYDGSPELNHMTNPSPEECGDLLKQHHLVGFNNRKYDNHFVYARYIGYSIPEIYKLSKRIIENDKDAMFMEAYNASYTDIYDFSSAGNKKSLKRWQIELGIHHQELGLDWDKPVPDELIPKVVEYCDNDVKSEESVFHHLAADFKAREILAGMSGLTVNDTTNKHSIRIIFGDNKTPQSEFNYEDLSETFPGYKYEFGKSTYRGITTGEGGYVYAEPGMYTNVAVLDIASMHPASIVAMNLFGSYTEKFGTILQARLHIKHKELDKAGDILGLEIDEDTNVKALSDALKTVINSVYGLTSAKFDNPFRDIRNVDNIVAKRGALFMVDLMFEVQERGFTVAHIKTDSIKIPNATPEILMFVEEFGRKHGYTFEHENTYDRMCLVNDAVYVALNDGEWEATGTQFQEPFVFKTLFTKEPITFDDLGVTKSVTTALYLDFGSAESMYKTEATEEPTFVGRVGRFTPIKPDCGGGVLLREKDGKFYAATDSKGYFWMESEVVKTLGKESDIDLAFFNNKVDAAYDQLTKYGDAEWFLGTDNKEKE